MSITHEDMKQDRKYGETYRTTSSIQNAPVVAGVSPDEPIVVNEQGGKQSQVLYRFDLVDPLAMFEMCKVLEYGTRRYEPWNWLNIPVNDHLNHLIIHAYAHLAGDTSDEHLSHIMCRAMFAQGVELRRTTT